MKCRYCCSNNSIKTYTNLINYAYCNACSKCIDATCTRGFETLKNIVVRLCKPTEFFDLINDFIFESDNAKTCLIIVKEELERRITND